MKIENINEKLKNAPEDPVVKIRRAVVIEGARNTYNVAEIGKQVQAHVHRKEDEFYHVLEGGGILYIGKVEFKENKPVRVHWEQPIKVKQNDVFVIPEEYAHSLKNTSGKLVIAFICPLSHMTTDRIIVDNP